MKKVAAIAIAVPFVVMSLISCSKDDDEASGTENGQAQFSGSGSDNFELTGATAKWEQGSAFSFNDRKYSRTMVDIYHAGEDVRLNIEIFVHDSAATDFGGKLPYTGTYDFIYDHTEREEAEGFVETSVDSDNLNYSHYTDHPDCEGTLTITRSDGEVIEGSLEVTDLWAPSTADDSEIDVSASFSAVKK